MKKIDRRKFLHLSALSTTCFTLNLSAFSTKIPNQNIAYISATEQIERFKKGLLSPVDVLEAQIKQINTYNGPLNSSKKELPEYMSFNGKVNAITNEYFENALILAKESEARYKNGTQRALEGITVAIKDEHCVKGWRVTQGAVTFQDSPACEDNSAIIDKLLDAGAIPHIQTTVPEYYIHFQTWSKLWGVTRNPWNLAYATGASSGGSSAALAAGFTTLATGSDMGGSIRVPASLCGLFGFKAPFGRVPSSDISYESSGPLARTIDDLALMQSIISGVSPKVHSSLRTKIDYLKEQQSIKGLRIAVDYCINWKSSGLDISVLQSMRKAIEVLRLQGAIIEEVDLKLRSEEIFIVFSKGLCSTGMCEDMINDKSNLTSYTTTFLKKTSGFSSEDAFAADELTQKLHRNIQKNVFQKGYTALLMPTLTTPYILATDDGVNSTIQINEKAVPTGMDNCITFIWNMLSRYPVVNVPIGIAPNNIPLGMQIVGNTFDDLEPFRIAKSYSQSGIKLFNQENFPDFRNHI